MKKATSKRERKYGKKNQDGIRTSKTAEERIVKLLVDHGSIMKFKNMKEAEAFIKDKNEEAERRGHPKASFIFL